MEKFPKFDIVRDIKAIEDGGLFCQACLVGKNKEAISPDPRYCQDCYDLLRETMETDKRWSHLFFRIKEKETEYGKES